MSSLTSVFTGFLQSGPDRLYVSIAGTAFFVFALVAIVLFTASRKRKIDLNQGAFSYLKFIYANFLKPHDRGGSGQQDALESFYKTQV
jgi:betaine lipid synthase